MNAKIHVYTNTCIQLYLCTIIPVYNHTIIHVYNHTCIYVSMYTCIHECKKPFSICLYTFHNLSNKHFFNFVYTLLIICLKTIC